MQIYDTYLFSVQLDDGATNQYPRARVYNSSGTLVTTADLTHRTGGLYQNSTTWAPVASGKFSVQYIIYSDSGHTTVNTSYKIQDENIEVSDYEFIIRALLNYNSRVKNQTYNASNKLTAFDWYIYKDATDANANTGEISTIHVDVTYDTNNRTTMILGKKTS